jgi:hypothetical protein
MNVKKFQSLQEFLAGNAFYTLIPLSYHILFRPVFGSYTLIYLIKISHTENRGISHDTLDTLAFINDHRSVSPRTLKSTIVLLLSVHFPSLDLRQYELYLVYGEIVIKDNSYGDG